MIVLALDTSLSAASACVWSSELRKSLAVRSEVLQRGHERVLLALVEEAMREAEIGFDRLDRIAAVVGPGSFTGLRIAVAAARAISLASEKPAVGISTLAALAGSALPAPENVKIAVAVDARNGRIYGQIFDRTGRPLCPSELTEPAALADRLGAETARFIGPAAEAVARESRARGGRIESLQPTPVADILVVARLGALAAPGSSPPSPFYSEAPTAASPEIRPSSQQRSFS